MFIRNVIKAELLFLIIGIYVYSLVFAVMTVFQNSEIDPLALYGVIVSNVGFILYELIPTKDKTVKPTIVHPKW